MKHGNIQVLLPPAMAETAARNPGRSTALRLLPFSHVPVVDGLRALSILTVVAAHYISPNVFPGGFGVTMFFFISGFLITSILQEEFRTRQEISYKRFVVRRFLRLGPAMYVCILIVIAAYLMAFNEFYGLSVLGAITYISNYGSLVQTVGYPIPLWSLAIEEHFYLLFPLLLMATLTRGIWIRGGLFGALLAFALGWRIILTAVFHAGDARIYVGTDTRIDSIVYGVVLAIAAMDVEWGPRLRGLLNANAFVIGLLLIFLSLVLRDEFYRQTFRYSLQGIGLFLSFGAIIFGNVPTAVTDILAARFLSYIGKISYSFYLYHLPVQVCFLRLTPLPKEVNLAAAVLVSFLLAALSYQFVERPFIRLRRSYGSHAEA